MGLKRTEADDNDIELLERDDPMQRMPFLGVGSKRPGKGVASRVMAYSRHFRKFGAFLIVLVGLVFVFDTWGDAFLNWIHSDFDDALTPDKDNGKPLHVLIPATHKDVNLCKTTLGLNILGYPDPTFLGWGKHYKNKDMVHGGAQIDVKITQPLQYVMNLKDEEDLVLIADGYDTWFQLPESVLRDRYYRLLAGASYHMRHTLGRRAIRREAIKPRIVFAAGKTCTPNNLHTVACYPVTRPPLGKLYGKNTDTFNGTTKYSSFRPRYLDAGYMMGPVREMRQILQRAQELVETLPISEETTGPYSGESTWTEGGPRSAHLYHGDAQSIFARIFGEQEFQREVIRLRYRSWFKKWSPPHTPGAIEGKKFKDVINPPFKHEKMPHKKGHPDEYGIYLDYTGLLGASTAHSERDFKPLVFDGSWNKKTIPDLNKFDCTPRLTPTLPKDIQDAELRMASEHQLGPSSWDAASKLWANICRGNIPVMVHHNGKKDLRQKWWHDVWYQADGRKMIKQAQAGHPGSAATNHSTGVAGWNQDGEHMYWRSICPEEYDDEVFGGPM